MMYNFTIFCESVDTRKCRGDARYTMLLNYGVSPSNKVDMFQSLHVHVHAATTVPVSRFLLIALSPAMIAERRSAVCR
eukprot:5625298-Pleurochrysis_carterae.AAC.1